MKAARLAVGLPLALLLFVPMCCVVYSRGIIPSPNCSVDVPCDIADGQYVARAPTGWNGTSLLPIALWFHGYQQSPADVVRTPEIADVFSRAGILLIVPRGRDGSWSAPNAPTSLHPRDEVAFVDHVIANVATHFPIDRNRTMAAGFSLGATMVWTEACAMPGRFAAYVAFSGDFWEPMPVSCLSGRVRLLHIHGLADQTFPITGRAIGPRWHQGNALGGLELWRNWKSCTAMAPSTSNAPDLTCSETGSCRDGSRIAYCQHNRNHEVDTHWLEAAIAWVEERWTEDARALL